MAEARGIMTLGLGAPWAISSHRFMPTLWFVLFLALAGVLVARSLPLVPITVMLALALSSTITNHYPLHGVGEIADGQVVTAELVPETSACLGHDDSTKHYALWLYRLQLPEMQHRRVNVVEGGKPCGSYLVATDDAILNSCPVAEQLGTEPRAKWSMWYYPSNSCN